jgi:hypothetical protein
MPETITAAEYRATRKKPKHTEDEIQRHIVAVFRSAYPSVLIFAVPNGGARSKTEAAIMNGTGTLAGVADLIVCWPERVGFLEVKAPGKYQQPSQKEFEARCVDLGLPYAVVRSVDDALECLRKWGAI